METMTKQIVPDNVKHHEFGCTNCLWAGAECKEGSKYKPSDKRPCDAYTYFD